MRLIRFPCFLLAAVLTAGAALSPRPAQAILGGELDGNRHPNTCTFVVTRANLPDIDISTTRGSGVLIHPRVVATAAHLIVRIWELRVAQGWWNREDLRCAFGTNAFDPDGWLEIETMIMHPKYAAAINDQTGLPPMDYGLGALANYEDIGLVILKKPVVGVTPATLAPLGFLDFLEESGALGSRPHGAKITVVGYGDSGDAPDKFLPRDGFRRVAQSEFLFLQPAWLFLDQNAAHGNAGSAEGDSGGPNFWVDPVTGQEILVSLVSRGDWVGVAMGTTYRTDTAEALDFIDAVLTLVEAGLL